MSASPLRQALEAVANSRPQVAVSTRRLVSAGAIILGFLVLAPGAAAAADGFYAGGALGAVFRQPVSTVNSEATDPFGNRVFVGGAAAPYLLDDRTHYDTGVEADLSLGYRFDLGRFGALRPEAEVSYRRFGIGRTDVQSAPNQPYGTTVRGAINTLSGSTQERYAGTANLFYDFTGLSGVTPYVGLGVGYQHGTSAAGSRQRNVTIVGAPGAAGQPSVTTIAVPSGSSDDGTYLAEVGLAIPLTARLSLVPAYRYTQAFGGHNGASLAKVGVRFTF